jgi:uncharacterized protein (TIGR02118 family)
MGVIKRKEGLDKEQFREIWRERHAPIVEKMTGIRHYHQNFVVNDQQLGIGFAGRGPIEMDGLSELWFDDLYSMEHGIASQKDAAEADLKTFTGGSTVIAAFKCMVVEFPKDWNKPVIKRITFLKRQPQITPEQFQYEWTVVHAKLVNTMPHVLGYNQNVILGRYINGDYAPYEQFPYDGVVEFKFENVEKLEACFASPEYAETRAHGETFLDTMTTFLVEESVIF